MKRWTWGHTLKGLKRPERSIPRSLEKLIELKIKKSVSKT